MAEEVGALQNAWNQGLEEMRMANAGQMAMETPPIEAPQAVEAPQAAAVEAPQSSYMEALNQGVEQAQSMEPSVGMER